jgi:hypothetical protein
MVRYTLRRSEIGRFRRRLPNKIDDKERWSRLAGQNGGLAKVDSGFDYAANFSWFVCIA